MTSARERAVEAGARAICAVDYDGEDMWDDHHLGETIQVNYREGAIACLRAAFPILAEELVEVAEANMHSSVMPGHVGQNIATALRARIQQMAEAEHE